MKRGVRRSSWGRGRDVGLRPSPSGDSLSVPPWRSDILAKSRELVDSDRTGEDGVALHDSDFVREPTIRHAVSLGADWGLYAPGNQVGLDGNRSTYAGHRRTGWLGYFTSRGSWDARSQSRKREPLPEVITLIQPHRSQRLTVIIVEAQSPGFWSMPGILCNDPTSG